MTKNTAKQRLLEGKPAIGAEVGLGSPLSAEKISPLGFDFVLVDNQHGAWDDRTTFQAFRSIALGKATPMARVRQNTFSLIGRLVDSGALGVVVPMVNTVEQAEAAAFAIRYPPRGGRSDGPFGAGFHGPDYDSRINDEVFLAVQIENIRAVEIADEIMAVDGVDGCWIGPGDLRRSMGVDLNTSDGLEAHTKAILHTIEACRRTGKIPGISTPSAEIAQRWIDEGCLFVTAGDDGSWAVEQAKEQLRTLGRTA